MSAARGSYSDILKCATDACRSGEKRSWHTIWKLRSAGYQNHFPARLIRHSSTLLSLVCAGATHRHAEGSLRSEAKMRRTKNRNIFRSRKFISYRRQYNKQGSSQLVAISQTLNYRKQPVPCRLRLEANRTHEQQCNQIKICASISFLYI